MAPKKIIRNPTCQEKLDLMVEEEVRKRQSPYAVKDVWGEEKVKIETEPFEHVTETIPFKFNYLAAWRDGFEITPEMLKTSERDVATEKSTMEMKIKANEMLKISEIGVATEIPMRGR